MEMILKIKDSAPHKVKQTGMFINSQRVTRKPVKVKFKSKEEIKAFTKSTKFKVYFEEVKAEDADKAQTIEEATSPEAIAKAKAEAEEAAKAQAPDAPKTETQGENK